MGTKREYAISLGLAVPGRGRLSREAHAAIAKAESNGMTFDDAKPTVKVTTSKPKTVKVGPVVEDEVPNPYSNLRYPDNTKFKGTDSEGKVHIMGGRNACMNCGYSLVGHICNEPVTLSPHCEPIRVEAIL